MCPKLAHDYSNYPSIFDPPSQVGRPHLAAVVPDALELSGCPEAQIHDAHSHQRNLREVALGEDNPLDSATSFFQTDTLLTTPCSPTLPLVIPDAQNETASAATTDSTMKSNVTNRRKKQKLQVKDFLQKYPVQPPCTEKCKKKKMCLDI